MKIKTNKLIAFNRNSILEAADLLFRDQGIEKTSMDQIAAKAEMTKPTIYAYFKDKNEIYYALVHDFMLKINDVIKSKSDGKDFDKTFLEICNEVFTLANKYPLYFDGMINEINVDINNKLTPTVYKDIYVLGEEINEALVSLIQKGKTLGKVNPNYDEHMLVFYLWSAIFGILRMYHTKEDYLALIKIDQKALLQFSFSRLLASCL